MTRYLSWTAIQKEKDDLSSGDGRQGKWCEQGDICDDENVTYVVGSDEKFETATIADKKYVSIELRCSKDSSGGSDKGNCLDDPESRTLMTVVAEDVDLDVSKCFNVLIDSWSMGSRVPMSRMFRCVHHGKREIAKWLCL